MKNTSASTAKDRLKRVTDQAAPAAPPMMPPPVSPFPQIGLWFDKLRNGNWQEKQRAARALREFSQARRGPDNTSLVTLLLPLLEERDWVVRWAAVEALAWLRDPRVIAALAPCLRDDHWNVRVAALRACIEQGSTAAAVLIQPLLKDKYTQVREVAAEALGILRTPTSIPALAAMLGEADDFVRLAAVEALGKFEDADATQALVRALQDRSDHVRWSAVSALRTRAASALVPVLLPLLADKGGPRWENRRICDLVIDALRNIGTPEAQRAVREWQQRE